MIKKLITASLLGLSFLLITACGAKDKAKEISSELNIKAKINNHWLMTQSEHASKVENWVENESLVLTFKDGKAGFSPADSVKGHAVYATLSRCTAETRPFQVDNNQLIFEAVPGCGEKRVTVEKIDDNTLKFPDPENGDITRTFVKINDETYSRLVKASERRP